MDGEKDVEAAVPRKIPFFKQVLDHAGITPEVEQWPYDGSGTEDDPYVVTWIDDDPRNPMLYSSTKKWALTMVVAIATLAVAFVSSAYSGGARAILVEFHCSQIVYTLGISLFVLGFAIGPLIWAPMSELFGRQKLYIITYGALTAFNAGAAGSQNITTLIVLRFFAGAWGSSPLTNAGGVIADMFPARDRGLAMSLFAAAPFMGPVLGPIVGGFVGESIGWRWTEGIMAIFTGVIWIVGCLVLPETYPPVILRARAAKLSKMTGKVYRSQGDVDQGSTSTSEIFKTSLLRPWILLFREPIVFLLSIYMSIIYGTLYMLFAAFPIVYQQNRGWSPGIGGLAFGGVAVGMMLAVAYSIWNNKHYAKISDEHNGFAPPEARLPACMLGGICAPIGMIWFAWTNYPSIHYMVSIAAGVPFGFGMVLIFLGVTNYLIDTYTIFAASVLAANAVLRSCFGAGFPLFTSYMYAGLGIHWASMVPAFLALACAPFPFLFYKYGAAIRMRCKYAAEADKFMKKMAAEAEEDESDSTSTNDEFKEADVKADEKDVSAEEHEQDRKVELEEVEEPEPVENELERARTIGATDEGFRAIRTTQATRPAPLSRTTTQLSRRSTRSGRSVPGAYDWSPYDLDRINTRDSFVSEVRARSRAASRAAARPAASRQGSSWSLRRSNTTPAAPRT